MLNASILNYYPPPPPPPPLIWTTMYPVSPIPTMSFPFNSCTHRPLANTLLPLQLQSHFHSLNHSFFFLFLHLHLFPVARFTIHVVLCFSCIPAGQLNHPFFPFFSSRFLFQIPFPSSCPRFLFQLSLLGSSSRFVLRKLPYVARPTFPGTSIAFIFGHIMHSK